MNNEGYLKVSNNAISKIHYERYLENITPNKPENITSQKELKTFIKLYSKSLDLDISCKMLEVIETTSATTWYKVRCPEPLWYLIKKGTGFFNIFAQKYDSKGHPLPMQKILEEIELNPNYNKMEKFFQDTFGIDKLLGKEHVLDYINNGFLIYTGYTPEGSKYEAIWSGDSTKLRIK